MSMQPQTVKRRYKKPGEESSKRVCHENDISSHPILQQITEAGILKNISLRNFMCHEHLDFTFNPKVNFIVGVNGSGKSALLVAVVVGLGGNARGTNRGSSVKELIQTGKKSATIEVTLRNEGTEAYKPDEYGDCIVVVRQIQCSGSSTYKVKSAWGRIISTKREDLNHITDHFNIQVDNPISILNQDTAKNFLRSKDPKDCYQFFQKATQLRDIKAHYKMAQDEKRQAKVNLESKQELLPEVQKQVDELERKFKFHQNLDKLRKKKERLQQELVWAQIKIYEDEVVDKQKVVDKEQRCIETLNSKLDGMKQEEKELLESKRNIEAELQQFMKAVSAMDADIEEARKCLREKIQQQKEMKLNMKTLNTKRSQRQAEKKRREEEIINLRTTAQADYTAKREARLAKIGELEKKLQSVKATQATTQHHHDQLVDNRDEHRQEHQTLTRERNVLRRELDNKERYLEILHQKEGSEGTIFGTWVPALSKRITEAAYNRLFQKQRPIGPLGTGIKVRDPIWAPAVESCLSSILSAYVVDNMADAKVMHELISMTAPARERKPSVIVNRFRTQIHDVSKFRVQSEQYQSMWDVLEIKNPNIANCVIDQMNVESIVLMPTSEEAYDVMSDRNKVPHNCRLAYTPQGDVFYPDPNYKSYAGFNKKKAERLQVSVEEIIINVQEEVKKLKQDIANVSRRFDDVSSKRDRIQQELVATNSQLVKLRLEAQDLTTQLNQLRSDEEPEPVDITFLEREVKELELEIENMHSEESAVKQNLMELNKETVEAKNKYSQLDQKKGEALNKTGGPLRESMDEKETGINKLKILRKKSEMRRQEYNGRANAAKKELAKAEETLAKNMEKAEQICERVPVERSVAGIRQGIHTIEEQLRTTEADHGTKQDVVKKYYDAKVKLEKMNREMKMLELEIGMFDEMMKERKARLKTFEGYLTMRVAQLFRSYLSVREYEGKLKFNWDTCELFLQVYPSRAASSGELTDGSSRGRRDVKGLSGGERSFSTICLILSLWDAIETPFRILDEYDVFMDSVNRMYSIRMLLEATKGSKVQFVFISPQDMPNVEITNDVSIHRMRPPVRNATQEEERKKKAASTS